MFSTVLSSKALGFIILSSTISSLFAIFCAFFIQTRILAKFVTPMVSLSIGFILGVCFLHGLPEAFSNQSPEGVEKLFSIFLFGLLAFFLLEKSRLIRHNHHHEDDGHVHEHGFDKKMAGKNGLSILVGDSLHNFCDGIMVAAAFIHSPNMGIITAFAVFAHEIPQEMGDFLVLINAGFSRKKALLFNILSGFCSIIGGIVGYFFLSLFLPYIPYILVFAYSSLVYIAISDLLPQIQYHESKKEYFLQMLFVGLGLLLIYMLQSFGHGHLH
jgi:zinc and cadmium transporter